MNHSYHRAAGADSTDTVSTRAFLQQAVDHYPRLVAFSFTLELPYRETLADHRSLILRFHAEVWQRTGEYSRRRQLARRNSPPTILRWMWESVSASECKMVLLMNPDTLGRDRVEQDMSAIIGDAWRTVGEADNPVAGFSSFIISRADQYSFTRSFNQLMAKINEIASPIMTARTGVICP